MSDRIYNVTIRKPNGRQETGTIFANSEEEAKRKTIEGYSIMGVEVKVVHIRRRI